MTGRTGTGPIWRRGFSPPPLIPYLVAGDPDLETTADYLKMAARMGVFAVELGIPFSDPTADGPVIQAASQRALRHETALESILGWLSGIRTFFSLSGDSRGRESVDLRSASLFSSHPERFFSFILFPSLLITQTLRRFSSTCRALSRPGPACCPR